MIPRDEGIESFYYRVLQHDAFLVLKHADSLKGLFKGKSLSELASNSLTLRDELIELAKEHVLSQVKAYPFALLPVELALQTTGAGTAFLRWRKKDRSKMGVSLWEALVNEPQVSEKLISDLYLIECERIRLNMKISICHTISRRATEGEKQLQQAHHIYQRRVNKSML